MRLIFTFLLLAVFCEKNFAQSNIGIGNTAPTEKLDVTGNIKTDTLKANALKMSSNAAKGKILVSDSIGNASWQYGQSKLVNGNGTTVQDSTVNLGGVLKQNTTISALNNKLEVKDALANGTSYLAANFGGPYGTAGLSSTPTWQEFYCGVNNMKLSAVFTMVTALAGSSITARIVDTQGAVLWTGSPISYSSLYDGIALLGAPNVYVMANKKYKLEITATGNAFVKFTNTNTTPGYSSLDTIKDLAVTIGGYYESPVLTIVNGNVGIQNGSPSSTLHVNGAVRGTNVQVDNNLTVAGSTTVAALDAGAINATILTAVGSISSNTDISAVNDIHANHYLSAGNKLYSFGDAEITDSLTAATVLGANVNATNNVVANGQLRGASLTVTGGASAGNILQSDAGGNAAWVNANVVKGSIYTNYVGSSFLTTTIPLAANVKEFVGTASSLIYFNGNQRAVYTVNAGLGRATAGSAEIVFDLGYQLNSTGVINFGSAGAYVFGTVNLAANEIRSVSYSYSFKPPAGTYKVAPVLFCNTASFFNSNDVVNYQIQIVNE